VIAEATGIPFKQVTVRKGIWDGVRIQRECSLDMANRYSARIANGAILDRSIWNMNSETRYIAPADFIPRLADGVSIGYNKDALEGLWPLLKEYPPVISTLPLPMLCAKAGIEMPAFESFPIYTLKFKLVTMLVDVYQTVYNGGDSYDGSWYRISIHGNEVTMESSSDKLHIDPEIKAERACEILCICGASPFEIRLGKQLHGKIIPIDEHARQRAVAALTDQFNIYSLGRFATWRPLLLDDLVKDVRQIEKMINHGSYARKQVENKEGK
jgi:hypothetical protein